MARGGGRQQAGRGTETVFCCNYPTRQYSVRYPRVRVWPPSYPVQPILNDYVSRAANLLFPQKHTKTYREVVAYKLKLLLK